MWMGTRYPVPYFSVMNKKPVMKSIHSHPLVRSSMSFQPMAKSPSKQQGSCQLEWSGIGRMYVMYSHTLPLLFKMNPLPGCVAEDVMCIRPTLGLGRRSVGGPREIKILQTDYISSMCESGVFFCEKWPWPYYKSSNIKGVIIGHLCCWRGGRQNSTQRNHQPWDLKDPAILAQQAALYKGFCFWAWVTFVRSS